jgi:hypothetical protein
MKLTLLQKIINAILEIFRNEKIDEKENNKETLPEKVIEQSLDKKIFKFIDDLIYLGTNNPFTKKPYMDFRESSGKNSSPDLDPLIKRNGGSFADPYCLFGQQDILRAIERSFGIEFDLPKTGSTQKFWGLVKPEYKTQTPKPYTIGIYKKADEYKGHAVLCLGQIDSKTFSTFEFNTSPDAGQEIVRDGQGCYFKTRPLAGYGDMKLLGFVDIIKAIKNETIK